MMEKYVDFVCQDIKMNHLLNVEFVENIYQEQSQDQEVKLNISNYNPIERHLFIYTNFFTKLQLLNLFINFGLCLPYIDHDIFKNVDVFLIIIIDFGLFSIYFKFFKKLHFYYI